MDTVVGSLLFTCTLLFLFRPQYYKLLEQCVSQIVLHKSGIDPDFHYTKKFSLDVDPLIGKPLPPSGTPFPVNLHSIWYAKGVRVHSNREMGPLWTISIPAWVHTLLLVKR